MKFITKVVIPLSVLFSTCIYAAQPTILVRVNASTQGQISGESTQQACVDCIEVIGFSHEVISPRDIESGLPTGQRQHMPLVLVKEIDSSTPLLANVLFNNENLVEVEIIFIRHNERTPYYVIRLTNASIAGIRTIQDVGSEGPPKEHISFTYWEVMQTWVESEISAQDNWQTPSA